MRTWVIVGPHGLEYVGLHECEADVWTIYLGWPSPEEVAEKKAEGWYAAPANITWKKPGGAK